MCVCGGGGGGGGNVVFVCGDCFYVFVCLLFYVVLVLVGHLWVGRI